MLRNILPALLLISAGLQAQTSLKDAFKDYFRVGAALNEAQFTGRDRAAVALIQAQFNSITPENVLKWELVHPTPGAFRFEPADAYVTFGEANRMFIVGHCLVWHQQTPKSVFEDVNGAPLGRQGLLDRMRRHILAVVGRYKGRMRGWDVVNEALNEDGTLRPTLWMKIIGEDYIAKAYEYAHEADPAAELYYNDYSLENPAKRRGAVELVRKLKARGMRVTAVGLQAHDNLDWPTIEQEEATIDAFAALGVKVNITELDVDVLPRMRRQPSADLSATTADPAPNPYTAGLPESLQQKLADRYAALFGVFLKHRADITRVTFWGVHDGASWLNNFPVKGRTNYPLLFDRNYRPKSAFNAVIETARNAHGQ